MLDPNQSDGASPEPSEADVSSFDDFLANSDDPEYAEEKPRDPKGRFAARAADAAAEGDDDYQPTTDNALSDEELLELDGGDVDDEGTEPGAKDAKGEKPEGEDADDFTLIAEVAKRFEIDEAGFLSNVAIEHDGKKVPLADVVKAYRDGIEPAAVPDDAELVRIRTEAKAKGDATLKELQETVAGVLEIITASRPTREQLTALREEDASKYLETVERLGAQDRAMRAAIERLKAADEEMAEERQAAMTRYADEQHKLLLKAMPELRDKEKAKATQARLTAYLKDRGLADKTISQISDAWLIQTVLEAADYRDLRARAAKAKEKLAAAKLRGQQRRPQTVVAAGARNIADNAAAPDQRRRAALTKRLRASGDVRDAAALFLEDMED